MNSLFPRTHPAFDFVKNRTVYDETSDIGQALTLLHESKWQNDTLHTLLPAAALESQQDTKRVWRVSLNGIDNDAAQHHHSNKADCCVLFQSKDKAHAYLLQQLTLCVERAAAKRSHHVDGQEVYDDVSSDYPDAFYSDGSLSVAYRTDLNVLEDLVRIYVSRNVTWKLEQVGFWDDLLLPDEEAMDPDYIPLASDSDNDGDDLPQADSTRNLRTNPPTHNYSYSSSSGSDDEETSSSSDVEMDPDETTLLIQDSQEEVKQTHKS